MPLHVKCPGCGWSGALPVGRTCPSCKASALVPSPPEAMVVEAPRPRATLAEVVRRDPPALVSPPALAAALELVARAGYALVPLAEADAAVTSVVSAPTPVTEWEYATITAHGGQVWASGAGVAGNTKHPSEDAVPAMLNELGRLGYDVCGNVVFGARAMWTLRRPTRRESLVRSSRDPVVTTPSTGAALDENGLPVAADPQAKRAVARALSLVPEITVVRRA